jgi:uncharacterized protein (DUF1501 family)
VSNQLVSWLQDHSVLILAALAVVEGIICVSLLRMARHARHEMKAAQAAAIEAARAAAMAAPGAIDPEAVLALLRQGHAPTLDNVYAMMRRREAESEAAAIETKAAVATPARAPAGAKGAQTASPAAAPASTSLSSSEVEERLRQYER